MNTIEKQAQCTQFKAPEGKYVLYTERVTGLVPFQAQRGSQLTLATLSGGPEDGTYIVFNVGDVLHIALIDATDKEPVRSLLINQSGVRNGFATCHAHAPVTRDKDGVDLLVGVGTGHVLMMSLRAQLQPTANGNGGSIKPIVSAIFNADGAQDSSRCNAVAWVQASEGQSFVAAHASGTLYVYRKGQHQRKNSGVPPESASSKFSFSSTFSSSSKVPPNVNLVYQVGGGGLNDVAFSPDGTKLAIACRDGALRVLDAATGTLVAGFQAYYGALLCCAFSPDGRYIAAGGEDDLVAVYGVTEKQVVAWGEGHSSWVSGVAFDPRLSTPAPATPMASYSTGLNGAATPSGGSPLPGVSPSAGAGAAAAAAAAGLDKFYRIASVGQDAQLCFWDLGLEEVEPAAPALGFQPYPMKRVGSSSLIAQGHHRSNSGVSCSSPDLFQLPQMAGIPAAPPPPPPAATSPVPVPARRSGSSNNISGSVKSSNEVPFAVPPATPRVDMTMLPPVMQHRIHSEPLSDILITDQAIFTACYSGQVKCWERPAAEQSNGGQPPRDVLRQGL